MMQLDILAIGRLKQEAELKLQLRYMDRINNSGPALGIKSIKLTELVEAKSQSTDARKKDEASRLLNGVPKGSFFIALDEHGKNISSTDFACLIKQQADEGQRSMSFAIGGPDGHGKELLQKANMRLSLSKMTLPHGLARVFLIEQIYRAITISSGHPYHRD